MHKVRRANPGDLSLIVDFQMRMALESEGLSLRRDVLAEGVRAVLEGRVPAEYWIAESEDGPDGMLMTVPEWSDWRNATVIWVHSVYVRPEARRQGAYAALYEHLREQVERSDELAGLRLYVDRRNLPAQRVYERLGMTREHYYLYEWMKPDEGADGA